MKQFISKYRAIYEDQYHGLFSRQLADWAVGKMMAKDPATGKMKPISPASLNEVADILAGNGADIPKEYIYTAWYLFNMALADYPKTLKTDEQRAMFVEETLCDPDGDPTNVLACFEAKMCNAYIPIYWELYI